MCVCVCVSLSLSLFVRRCASRSRSLSAYAHTYTHYIVKRRIHAMLFFSRFLLRSVRHTAAKPHTIYTRVRLCAYTSLMSADSAGLQKTQRARSRILGIARPAGIKKKKTTACAAATCGQLFCGVYRWWGRGGHIY